MIARASTWGIVLVLAAFAAHGAEGAAPASPAAVAPADGDEDGSAYMKRYEATERQLYDTLSMDPSPRTQVLVGRVNLSSTDEATPTALRPKSSEVIAQAAQRDATDAFVQWMAASQGSFSSSQCGPTVWPEAEVANLLRLEPDNAVAWQFAVALAVAKGSQAGVDEALAQMASAPMADDHFSDELGTWNRVYSMHPELVSSLDNPDEESGGSTQTGILDLALQRLAWRGQPAMSALEQVCKPDAENEITWQRAAWCADAATVLATRGTSLGLREQGLKLLAIVGDRSAEVADLQRTHAWMAANRASPMANYHARQDADADRATDWRGDANEVVATERRLKRLGQPLTAPGGWVSEEDRQASDERAARTVWRDYLRTLVDAMRGGSDPDAQAAAAVAESTIATIAAISASDESGSTEGADASQAGVSSSAATELADIARSHPDRPLVQWLAAASGQLKGEPKTAAVANVQRLEPDNAAAWALSLDPSTDDAEALHRAAAGTRFDSHTSVLLRVWLDAAAAHPAPAKLADSVRKMQQIDDVPDPGASDQNAAISTATTMVFSAEVGAAPVAISRRCVPTAEGFKAEDRDSCIAVGRLMLRSGTSMLSAMFGEVVLRKFGALESADETRAAVIRKGRSAMAGLDAQALPSFVREYISTGSEIEAMRIVTGMPAATDAAKAK